MGTCHTGIIGIVAVITIILSFPCYYYLVGSHYLVYLSFLKGFGLLIAFTGIANVQNGLIAVNIVGGLINICTGAVLLAGAIKNNRKYVSAFLGTWWILLTLGTIGFIIMVTKYDLIKELIIWGIVILVIRWLMQFAVLWAYCNMEKPTTQASFKV